MKACKYCGNENDDSAPNCHGCGTEFENLERQPAARGLSPIARRVIWCFALLTGTTVLLCGGLFLGVGALLRGCDPPTPRSDYDGQWRTYSVFGVEERLLPPASNVWWDYQAWKPKRHQDTDRLYKTRLGGAERQTNFWCRTNFGDTPMGAQFYTHIDFLYCDPTNGTYALTWSMRGKHDPSFLKFDDRYRLFQLQPVGDPNESPPRLLIRAIEGMKAWD